MFHAKEIKKSLIVSIWFAFLTFPIIVIRVNTIEKTIEWRWFRLAAVVIGSFFLSFLWRYMLRRQEMGRKAKEAGRKEKTPLLRRILSEKRLSYPSLIVVGVFFILFPFLFSSYQTTIISTALLYVMLGLGLNIVVGLAGLLDLGYVAFYAVGAYTYALLNIHFGIGFWLALPIGAGMAALFGILLGFPVLRLRGDYLAIVTLGFGEIIRLILENWNAFSYGPSGIKDIPRPNIFGLELNLDATITSIYFIIMGGVVMTIFFVNRLQYSRIGRAWMALREDEIACQAMGIDKTKTKLTAFALGATWAGMAGVILAAKTTFINPPCFTLWESVAVLCIVVLGGMGSIPGVIFGAFIYMLLPEYLRVFQEFRMIIFPTMLVVMMIFRPQGIISDVRATYRYKRKTSQPALSAGREQTEP